MTFLGELTVTACLGSMVVSLWWGATQLTRLARAQEDTAAMLRLLAQQWERKEAHAGGEGG
jgi:hypothetical protein